MISSVDITPNGYSVATARRAGIQGKIEAAGDHFLSGSRGERFQQNHLIAVCSAGDIGEDHQITGAELG